MTNQLTTHHIPIPVHHIPMFCQCGPHISPSLQLFKRTTHKVFAAFLEAQKLLGYVQETTGDA